MSSHGVSHAPRRAIPHQRCTHARVIAFALSAHRFSLFSLFFLHLRCDSRRLIGRLFATSLTPTPAQSQIQQKNAPIVEPLPLSKQQLCSSRPSFHLPIALVPSPAVFSTSCPLSNFPTISTLPPRLAQQWPTTLRRSILTRSLTGCSRVSPLLSRSFQTRQHGVRATAGGGEDLSWLWGHSLRGAAASHRGDAD